MNSLITKRCLGSENTSISNISSSSKMFNLKFDFHGAIPSYLITDSPLPLMTIYSRRNYKSENDKLPLSAVESVTLV